MQYRIDTPYTRSTSIRCDNPNLPKYYLRWGWECEMTPIKNRSLETSFTWKWEGKTV